MRVIPCEIKEVLVIEPAVFEDDRGFFMESYNQRLFEEAGISVLFVQDNHSRSIRNTLRGLHYQISPGQDKLVRVIRGEVFDVAVDIRFGSPTFGQWVGKYLSEENKHQLFIPKGFAHGFCALSDIVEFEYKCSEFYSRSDERGIRWDDPDLAIRWPVTNPLLSEKDRKLPFFKEISKNFIYSSK